MAQHKGFCLYCGKPVFEPCRYPTILDVAHIECYEDENGEDESEGWPPW